MSLYGKDYNGLFQLQDKFLKWWPSLHLPFYLTGGTALGRFYLMHRKSEDLDFFVNGHADYANYITIIKPKIEKYFDIDVQQSLFAADFTRFFISGNGHFLKIEFINDVSYYAGKPNEYEFGIIDNPTNILANKLTAIVGRDEPKDMFDILHLCLNYSFNWQEIFAHAKQKSAINELDIVQRIESFPLEWLENVNWLSQAPDVSEIQKLLTKIADDFLLGLDNSLGIDQVQIEKAKPLVN